MFIALHSLPSKLVMSVLLLLILLIQSSLSAQNAKDHPLLPWEETKYMIPYCIAVRAGMPFALSDRSDPGVTTSAKEYATLTTIRRHCADLSREMNSLGQTARQERTATSQQRLSDSRAEFYNQQLRRVVIQAATQLSSELDSDSWRQVQNDLLSLRRGTTEAVLGEALGKP